MHTWHLFLFLRENFCGYGLTAGVDAMPCPLHPHLALPLRLHQPPHIPGVDLNIPAVSGVSVRACRVYLSTSFWVDSVCIAAVWLFCARGALLPVAGSVRFGLCMFFGEATGLYFVLRVSSGAVCAQCARPVRRYRLMNYLRFSLKGFRTGIRASHLRAALFTHRACAAYSAAARAYP